MPISILTSNASNISIKISDYNSSSYLSSFTYNNYSNDLVENAGDINKILPVTDFVSSFSKNNSILKDTGIMPPGLLYATKKFLVFEKPPCYQNVSIIYKQVDNINYDFDEENIYRIPIPWQLYIIKYHESNDEGQLQYYTTDVRMYFMKNSLMQADQEMFMVPIPNFYSNGDLCRPFFSDMDDVEKYSKDFSGVIQSAYDWIWNSGTNLDLTETVAKYYAFYQDKKENTILEKITQPFFSSIHKESYYISDEYISAFFKAWEKFDLHEVSNINWVKNSQNPRFYSDFSNARTNSLNDYLSTINQSEQLHRNIDCCDSCTDYDEEIDDYVNREDCECECHIPETPIDYDAFYAFAGVWPPKGFTYLQALESFIGDESEISYYQLTRHIRNIEDQVLMS
jgi:hypothetical protein